MAKQIVVSHSPLFYDSFWNFSSQNEKRKLYSLFVLELPLPDQKEKADLPQFVLEQIEKQATIRFGSRLPNRREDAKTEIGFTVSYGSRKRQRHYSIMVRKVPGESHIRWVELWA